MSRIARQAARAAEALAPVAEGADAVAGALRGDAHRQRTSLDHAGHRPWPLPARPWVMAQSWVSLLFAHWPLEPERLRAVVPAQLALDLFDGCGWLTMTPFEVRATRPRGALPPPVLSHFPELNVRTYVTLNGRPGIWFFSLDAASGLAVRAARALYRLPYFRAQMRIAIDGPWLAYSSERADPRGAPAAFEGRYRPTGDVRQAAPGSLEAWLIERYRLYTVDERDRLFAADIHHRPWPLQDAAADIRVNTMAAPLGLELSGPPVLHFAGRQDVVFWALHEVEPAAD